MVRKNASVGQAKSQTALFNYEAQGSPLIDSGA